MPSRQVCWVLCEYAWSPRQVNRTGKMYQTPGPSYSWLPFACKYPRSYVDMAAPGSSYSGVVDMSTCPTACSSCSDSDVRPEKMHFINSKCVVFTYYKGDVSTCVDEHFSRALSTPSSFTKESPSSEEAHLEELRRRSSSSTESSVSKIFPSSTPISRAYPSMGTPIFPRPIPAASLQDSWLMNLQSRTSGYSGSSYFPYSAGPMYGYNKFW